MVIFLNNILSTQPFNAHCADKDVQKGFIKYVNWTIYYKLCAYFCYKLVKWSIVEYWTGAMWDLCNKSIVWQHIDTWTMRVTGRPRSVDPF